MKIQDNGRSFDPKVVSDGYGLRGMHERISLFQGELTIDSRVGQGCCIGTVVSIELPGLELSPKTEISAWQPLNLNQW